MSEAEKPARILVVDDEDRNRRLFVAMLEADGYVAAEAADGAQALELVRQSPPDLVLLDIMMPGMDGYAVARALKANPASQSIPVVMVTALDDSESWRRGMEAGASDFLTKPVDRIRLGLRIRNLLALKANSDALAQREAEMRAMLDHLPDAVVQIDARGVVRSANPAVQRIFGHAPQALIGHSVTGLLPEPSRAELEALIEHHVRSGGARIIGIGREVTGLHKDGHLLDLDLLVTEYQRHGEHFFIGTLRDISERKRLMTDLREAREVAQAANRAKSEFLSTMSHEVRTPLNGMFGMLELLSLSTLDTEQHTTLEIVRDSSRSLLRIVDDILDFSKMEAGKLEIRPAITSIRKVIEDVRNTYSGSASAKGLLIKHSVDPRISPWVQVDALRLRQILNNFVSNALKFTTRGFIEIRAEWLAREGATDQVRFCVQDTGLGISAENQQRLFKPFSQGDSDAAREAGGTGLGLTICRRLAEMMGGSVGMASELGQGTTMTLILSLPIEAHQEQPKTDAGRADRLTAAIGTGRMQRTAPGVAQAEAEGTLVLVVDDHPTNRTLLARQLRTLGYEAESAEDGVQALDKWKSGRFGIVLTDCQMPRMDGYQLARAIRQAEADGPGARVPIIACTANALIDGEHCLAAGMDDFLVKPVALQALSACMARWRPLPPAPAPAGAPGADAAAASFSGVLDRQVLAAIAGGDGAAEGDILQEFRRVNDQDAARLLEAVARSDLAQTVQQLHRIKGASQMVGAVGLAAVCERIEIAARAADMAVVSRELPDLQLALQRLNALIDTIATGAGSP